MNRKLIALIILAGCDPNKTEDEQSAYDEGYAQGYQDAADALNADYSALEARLAAVEGQMDEVQPAIDDVQAQIDALGDELTTASGLPRFIDSDLTLNVPSEYEDVNVALEALGESVISQAATVTIQVADGTYTYDEAIAVSHENGDRIQIVGNAADPAAVELSFGSHGLVVSNGHTLGLLQGVTLRGSYAGGEVVGVLAERNALVTVDQVHTYGFAAGFEATQGGVLVAEGAQDSGSIIGLFALSSGVIIAESAVSTDNLFFGFLAERVAYMDVDRSTVTGAQRSCYYVGGGGVMDAEESTAEGCAEAGYVASGPGGLNAHASTSTGSGLYGYSAEYGAILVASSATAVGNGSAGFYATHNGQLAASAAVSEDNGAYGFLTGFGGTASVYGVTSSGNPTDYSPAVTSSSDAGAWIWSE